MLGQGRIHRRSDREIDSEEKHEPASDIDTVVVDSLKALDPKRPIREADIGPLGVCPHGTSPLSQRLFSPVRCCGCRSGSGMTRRDSLEVLCGAAAGSRVLGVLERLPATVAMPRDLP